MKIRELKNVHCGEMYCKNCPLRIFGCGARSHASIADSAPWSQNMTLEEVLESKVSMMEKTIADTDTNMRGALKAVVSIINIALLGYIDEEELDNEWIPF